MLRHAHTMTILIYLIHWDIYITVFSVRGQYSNHLVPSLTYMFADHKPLRIQSHVRIKRMNLLNWSVHILILYNIWMKIEENILIIELLFWHVCDYIVLWTQCKTTIDVDIYSHIYIHMTTLLEYYDHGPLCWS